MTDSSVAQRDALTAERDELRAEVARLRGEVAAMAGEEHADRCAQSRRLKAQLEAAEQRERAALRMLVRIDDGLNRQGWEEGENDREWGDALDDFLFNAGLCPATPEHAPARKALLAAGPAQPETETGER